MGRIGQHLPRVYSPWQQSELQWACGTFSGLLLPLAFWWRLASLAAGCVATIASPLYSNGVSGRFGAMRANLLRPMDAYASPPLPPLDTWSSPTSKQVQRFSFLLPRPMGNWTDGQMRNGPMALSSGLKYPCAAHTAMAPDCHSSNRGLVHLPHYCRSRSPDSPLHVGASRSKFSSRSTLVRNPPGGIGRPIGLRLQSRK